MNNKLDQKKPTSLSGILPINEVTKAKSNSGIFLKQLFTYKSLKVSLFSFDLFEKNNLKIIPVIFLVASNKSNTLYFRK